MEIIQQIAVKAVEEIFESVKTTGLNDIGKTINKGTHASCFKDSVEYSVSIP